MAQRCSSLAMAATEAVDSQKTVLHFTEKYVIKRLLDIISSSFSRLWKISFWDLGMKFPSQLGASANVSSREF